MQKGRHILTIIGIIIVVIATIIIIVGGVFVYQYLATKKLPIVINGQINKCNDNQIPADRGVMKQYTDSSFGFSFWYPSIWKVEEKTIDSSDVDSQLTNGFTDGDWFRDGTVIKEFYVGNSEDGFTIQEFYSPTSSITELGDTESASDGTDQTYYYDKDLKIWMYKMLKTSREDQPLVDKPATEVRGIFPSYKTMGGLYVFPGAGRAEADDIIPISTKKFVVVTRYFNRDKFPQKYLQETIMPTDPSVVTAQNQDVQKAIIYKEGLMYGIFGTYLSDDYLGGDYFGATYYIDNKNVYDEDGNIILGANPKKLTPIDSNSTIVTDCVHVYCDGELLEYADPATFTTIGDVRDNYYEKDKNHVWRGCKLVPGVDLKTFEVITKYIDSVGNKISGKDAYHVYGQDINYNITIDGKSILNKK